MNGKDRRNSMKQLSKLIIVIICATFALTACKSNINPKEYLKEVLQKSSSMKTYNVDGEISLDLKANKKGSQLTLVSDILKDAKLTYHGTFQEDPMKMEVTLNVQIGGDLEISLDLPTVITEDKMWIKIPKTPYEIFPKEVTGKFVEFDLADLAAESGSEIAPKTDMKMQEFALELVSILFSDLEEKEYFASVDAKDVDLPKGVEADEIVKISLDNAKLRSAAKVIVEKSAPKILDLIEKDYMSEFELSKSDLKDMRTELEGTSEKDIDKEFDKFDDQVDIKLFDVIIAADKNKFITHQEINSSFSIDVEGEKATIGIKADMNYTNINKDVEFKIDTSKSITLEEFNEIMDSQGQNFDQELEGL